jgi:WD40 repeat protein
MIASSSWDKTIKLWNKNTGDLLRTITCNCVYVGSVAFDANDMIASVSSNGTIQLWNKNTGELLRTLIGHGNWSPYPFDAPENPITSAASDAYDMITTTSHDEITTNAWPNAWINFAFDANYTLASGSWDSTVKLWNKYTGNLLKTLIGHTNAVTSVAFDASYMIASGSIDNTIKLWNKNTGDLLRTLTGHGDGVSSYYFNGVVSLAFDSNDMLASGSSDRTVRLWNKNTGYVK